ncbi:MAG: hypothetical protein ABR579_05490 [Actinomycetota bacterium]
MRRLLALVVSSLLLAALFVPPAQADLPGKQDGQVAFSLFGGTASGHPVLYLVGAIVFDQTQPQTLAMLARLPCTKVIHKGKPKLSCKGTLNTVTVLPPDLFVDPLLRNAHLSVDYQGLHTEVDWTSTDDAGPQYKTSPFVYAGLQVDADSSGEVLGHKFSSADEHGYSYMLEYASIDTSVHGVRITGNVDSGFHVDAKIPLASLKR